MTRYMLDTNIVSDLMRHPAGAVTRHIARVGTDRICLSIVTAAELRYGAARRASAQLLARVAAVLARIEVIALGPPADVEYATIRAGLEAVGQPIGPNDLLIAAHARALGATLVTANLGEFRRVPGLRIENWLA